MNAQELIDTAGPDKSAPHAAPAAPAGKGNDGHAKAGAQPAMSADMAHEMFHSGTDLAAMVRDMRNRFWICLIFTVPIFVYAPMGGFFKPPVPRWSHRGRSADRRRGRRTGL